MTCACLIDFKNRNRQTTCEKSFRKRVGLGGYLIFFDVVCLFVFLVSFSFEPHFSEFFYEGIF